VHLIHRAERDQRAAAQLRWLEVARYRGPQQAADCSAFHFDISPSGLVAASQHFSSRIHLNPFKRVLLEEVYSLITYCLCMKNICRAATENRCPGRSRIMNFPGILGRVFLSSGLWRIYVPLTFVYFSDI